MNVDLPSIPFRYVNLVIAVKNFAKGNIKVLWFYLVLLEYF